jgi:citrate lyase subunit beta / citryl-CoA lyase
MVASKAGQKGHALDLRSLMLFVPANRSHRLASALASGADAVIIDLEDAVPLDEKDAARQAMLAALAATGPATVPILVRVNAPATPWFVADCEALAHRRLDGVVLPKAELRGDIETLRKAVGEHRRVVALIETARGVASARQLAEAASHLAFGSLDFASDIGAKHTRDALLNARMELVLASKLAGLPGPIDGVTTAIDDPDAVAEDAAYAAALGFIGKLLIHPRQVLPASAAFAPSEAEIAWARRVIAATANNAVAVVDGRMVDAPVRHQAMRLLGRVATDRDV